MVNSLRLLVVGRHAQKLRDLKAQNQMFLSASRGTTSLLDSTICTTMIVSTFQPQHCRTSSRILQFFALYDTPLQVHIMYEATDSRVPYPYLESDHR